MADDTQNRVTFSCPAPEHGVNFYMSHFRFHRFSVPGKYGLTSLLLSAFLCFAAGAADAADLVVSRRAGEYDVTIRLDRNPPILGINNLEVDVREAGGKEVADAKVLINYYMPPMPRMAPMNYRVDAPFTRGKYRAAMNFIMEGPWYIVVRVGHQGKNTSAKFNVNVP